ncbi:MAG: hypothetical protein IJA65_04860, partial [Acholeplasmatales bacterium]|nr:hypothetical protein [Acholeplasmatales bacterium]
MDIEIIKEYSKKYKTHQVRLSMVFMILLIILGIIFIGVGIFLVIYYNDMWGITAIMILAGIFNIPLGIKFYYVS